MAEATRRAAYAGLKREEVIRRLRALAQPATLFGEEDSDRLQRLIKAEQDLQVEDEAVGGFYNALLELQRQEAKKAKKGGASSAGGSPIRFRARFYSTLCSCSVGCVDSLTCLLNAPNTNSSNAGN